jgi:regulator of RNase E activity RraA
MALRLARLSAKGIIVHGQVRDLSELRSTGLPIWALGTSTVGAGAESKPHAIDVPIKVGHTEVKAGDLVFMDWENGCVVIPQELVGKVVELLPRLVGADEKVKEDVAKGVSVKEAFQRHRGNL